MPCQMSIALTFSFAFVLFVTFDTFATFVTFVAVLVAVLVVTITFAFGFSSLTFLSTVDSSDTLDTRDTFDTLGTLNIRYRKIASLSSLNILEITPIASGGASKLKRTYSPSVCLAIGYAKAFLPSFSTFKLETSASLIDFSTFVKTDSPPAPAAVITINS